MTTRTDRHTRRRPLRAFAGLLVAALLALATVGAWHAAAHVHGAHSDDCSVCRVVGSLRADLAPAILHHVAPDRGDAVAVAASRAPASARTASAPARAPPARL